MSGRCWCCAFFREHVLATISSCCTTIGMRMSPPARRGQVIGILTSAVYLGLTLGPLIGGGVATVVGWRWLFFGILPPGLAVWCILRHNIRQEWTDAAGEKLDVTGALLFSFGLGCIALGGGCYGVAPVMLWLMVPGVILMGIFFWWQWHAPCPMVDMHMFRESPGLLTGLLAMFINYGSTMGMVFFLSLYLQEVRGFTPFYAGLFMMVQSFAQVVASPSGGKLADRFGRSVCPLWDAAVRSGYSGRSHAGQNDASGLDGSFTDFAGNGHGDFRRADYRSHAGAGSFEASFRSLGHHGQHENHGRPAQSGTYCLYAGLVHGGQSITPEHADTYLLAMRSTLICFGILNICGLCVGLKRLAELLPGGLSDAGEQKFRLSAYTVNMPCS